MSDENNQGVDQGTSDVIQQVLQGDGSVFAQSSAAPRRFGVIYQGAWETLDGGTCRAVRRHARALSRAGLPVLLKSLNHTRIDGGRITACYGDFDPEVLAEIGSLNHTEFAQVGIAIKHLVVTNSEQLHLALYPRSVIGHTLHETQLLQANVAASTVLYTVWERDQIPARMAELMSRAGQCWVPCTQNRDMLIRSGVPQDKVFVVPHPYNEYDVGRALKRTSYPQHPAFYAIGAWQPRKAYHELIGSFLRAFSSSDKATLRIKTNNANWPNYPSPRESIQYWLSKPEVQRNGWSASNLKGRLEIHTKTFTRTQIEDFHEANNIYVCCSHGEAWCLPAFDAKLYDNRLVYVPWGGPVDFADSNDMAIELLNDKQSVPKEYGWDGCSWASFAVDGIRYALASIAHSGCWKKEHEIRKQEALWSQLGSAGDQYLTEGALSISRFTEARIGELMNSLLRRLSITEVIRKDLWP